MKTYLDQITIYFNPSNNKHKKTVAHAKSAGKVLAIPFLEMPTANNVWTTIYDGLDKDIMSIFDQKFLENNAVKPARFEDWRKLAVHNLDHIDSPIAIRGKQVVICDRQTKIYQLMDMAV